MHKSSLVCAALSAAATGLGGGAWSVEWQQPAEPPRPSNPSPRPANPQPRPQQPGNDPSQTPRPGEQPPQDQPRVPDDRRPIEDRRQPDDRKDQREARIRNPRPFMFQNPQDEAKFVQSSRRLVQMEQRLEKSNQDLLKRLGEARQLSPDRQGPAVMDVLQQILRNQSELQQYMVQARTSWTGDVELGDEAKTASEPAAKVPQDADR